MLIKLPDGSQAELKVGSKVTLTSDVFGPELGTGPFEVVSFEGDMPNLLLATDAEGVQKIAPVSVELIFSVDNPDALKVEVKFPDGTVVLVDADLAPVLQAVIDSNQALMQKLADLLSGDELKAMQAQLDAMKLERDSELAFSDKLRGSLPALEAASGSLAEVIAALKG